MNQDGLYTDTVGHGMSGLSVLEGGTEKVLEVLGQEVLHRQGWKK